MGNKIKIKSLVGGTIVITDPTLRLRREWPKKGTVQIIDSDDLDILLYQSGVDYMFRQGMLGFVDEEEGHKILVNYGIEPEDKEEWIPSIEPEKLDKLMNEAKVSDFRKEIKKFTREQLIELTEYCIEKEYMQYEKVEILKDLTGTDIISAIRLNRQDKE